MDINTEQEGKERESKLYLNSCKGSNGKPKSSKGENEF